jgi:hypothetical protein
MVEYNIAIFVDNIKTSQNPLNGPWQNIILQYDLQYLLFDN